MKEELKKYINDNLILNEGKEDLFHNLRSKISNNYSTPFIEEELKEVCDIQEFINDNKDKYNSFQTTLFKFIDAKQLKDSDVYNKVHIDRRLFSKIRSDKNYHPSKETVLLLGFALELTESELEELLCSASYSLPKNNHYDLIIRFCFIHKIYNLINVNDLLHEYNCKQFSY